MQLQSPTVSAAQAPTGSRQQGEGVPVATLVQPENVPRCPRVNATPDQQQVAEAVLNDTTLQMQSTDHSTTCQADRCQSYSATDICG